MFGVLVLKTCSNVDLNHLICSEKVLALLIGVNILHKASVGSRLSNIFELKYKYMLLPSFLSLILSFFRSFVLSIDRSFIRSLAFFSFFRLLFCLSVLFVLFSHYFVSSSFVFLFSFIFILSSILSFLLLHSYFLHYNSLIQHKHDQGYFHR